MSDVEFSDNDSCSTTSIESVLLNQDDLLQVIQILLLPDDSEFDFDITRWKDRSITELLTDMYSKFVIEDEYFVTGAEKVLRFINANRQDLNRRKVSLRYFEDVKLKNMIKKVM